MVPEDAAENVLYALSISSQSDAITDAAINILDAYSSDRLNDVARSFDNENLNTHSVLNQMVFY